MLNLVKEFRVDAGFLWGGGGGGAKSSFKQENACGTWAAV